MLYAFIVYLVVYQQMLNWLFERYRTLTTLLSRNYINSKIYIVVCESK